MTLVKKLLLVKNKRSILLTFLILQTLFITTNTKYTVNGHRLAPFINKQNQESGEDLNFEEGEWYIKSEDDETIPTDGRVLEFHPYNIGLVNIFNDQEALQLSFLDSSIALIFFDDGRPPILGTPAFYNEMLEIPDEVSDYIEKLDEKFIAAANKLPFFKLNGPEFNKTYEIADLRKQIMEIIDHNDPDPEDTFYIKPSQETMLNFIKGVMLMIGDAILLQDYKVLFDLNSFKIKQADINPTQRMSVIEEFDKVADLEKSQKKFKALYDKLSYFYQKFTRRFFFDNDYFYDILFTNFAKGQVFQDLTQNLKNPELLKEVFNIINHVRISKEDTFDVNRSEDEYDLFNLKRKELMKAFKEVIEMVLSVLSSKIGELTVKFPNTSDYEYFDTLFDVVSTTTTFEVDYYNEYLAVFLRNFGKAQCLSDNGIMDLNNPDDIMELRKRLVILGEMTFDVNIDSDDIVHLDYNVFVENRRLLVI
jgi:hypothetical protein